MSEINLDLEKNTAEWIQKNRLCLIEVSPERILSEIHKLLDGQNVKKVMPLLKDFELMAPWQDNLNQSRRFTEYKNSQYLKSNEQVQALKMARLINIVSEKGLRALKPSKKLLRKYTLLRYWIKRVHEIPEKLSEAERLKLHRELEYDLPSLIIYLPLETQKAWIKQWRDPENKLFHPRPPLGGRLLQKKLGLSPGPLLGHLLDHLSLENAFGRIDGEESAIRESKKWCKQQLGKCD